MCLVQPESHCTQWLQRQACLHGGKGIWANALCIDDSPHAPPVADASSAISDKCDMSPSAQCLYTLHGLITRSPLLPAAAGRLATFQEWFCHLRLDGSVSWVG